MQPIVQVFQRLVGIADSFLVDNRANAGLDHECPAADSGSVLERWIGLHEKDAVEGERHGA